LKKYESSAEINMQLVLLENDFHNFIARTLNDVI